MDEGEGGKEQGGGEQSGHAGILDAVTRRDAAFAAPILILAVLLVASTAVHGAFEARWWLALAFFSMALLASAILSGAVRLPRRGALVPAVGALWAFVGFVALSAFWSESPGMALEGAARTALYAALFTLAAGLAIGSASRRVVGWTMVLGVVVIAATVEVLLLIDGSDQFVAGRLNEPLGYRNATASLFAFATWPLIGIAARRGPAPALRSGALAAAALVLGLAFLTQSRGVVIGLAAGAVVSLAIGPDRLRRVWLALALAAGMAVASGPLLGAFEASGSGVADVDAGEIRSAAVALLLLVAAVFAAGVAAFSYDSSRRGRAVVERGRTVAIGLLAVLAVGVAVAAVVRVGDPISYGSDKWEEFTEDRSVETGDTRYGTVGGPRYDIWRVAVEQFGEHPVVGAGEGSYRFAYYRERRSDRNLSDAHSLPLRILAETGLIGALLLGTWLVALTVAITRRARAAIPGERVWMAAMAAAGVTVFAQSTLDWMWLIPGLFGLGIVALGLAAGSRNSPESAAAGDREPGEAGEDRQAPAVAARVSAGVVAIVLALGAGALYLADAYERQARQAAAVDPASALDAARWAGRLAPLSVPPLYLEAGAHETLGAPDEARDALHQALDREPSNFVTLALLGDLEIRQRNPERARTYYRRALEQNPLDSGLRQVSQDPSPVPSQRR